MKSLVAALLLAAVVPTTAACGRPAAVEQTQSATIGEFWSAFRAAVAAGNPEGIAALADFPFQTRGPSDSDPVVPRDRAAFLQLVGQMLETDSGMKPEPEPMRALIARTPELRPSSAGGSSARVGSFVFRQVQGRWRFAMAYLDE